MRKKQKKQAEAFIKLLSKAHDKIKQCISTKQNSIAMELLEQCQEGAIKLGELIETTEGEVCAAIPLLEEYCEIVYQVHEELRNNVKIRTGNLLKNLRQSLARIENTVKNDIQVRLEVVFFSYKASMWDSLESVYLAAMRTPGCDAYCVPIPYYEITPDHQLGQMHYEGNEYPEEIQVTDWQTYNFEEKEPDVIFFHNPYDNWNLVTTVHPRYYSANLKKYTETLVYIPYYATSGGMSEGQGMLPAYVYADYIVIQSEHYRKYFDESIPDSKFLPLGSPKFDRVIRLCSNPPEPPAEWKEKIQGKKVYFYNTSINGMLADTDKFLKKMEYVFGCFEGRDDVCILWRPHPLLESTFESMRREDKPKFDEIKRKYIVSGLGIYDETPDIEKSIALSDAYIGDDGTSVTSLFGVAGKPIFILNNNINTLPGKDDWRGETVNPQFDPYGDNRFYITNSNELWYSENNDFHYKYYMTLHNEYSGGRYYIKAVEINGVIYIIPNSAQHILIIKDKRIIKKVELDVKIEHPSAFRNYFYNEKYIFLFPYRYPFLVRFDIESGKIDYIDGIKSFNMSDENGELRFGGFLPFGNELLIASASDGQVIAINMHNLKTRKLRCGDADESGILSMMEENGDIWILPMHGKKIIKWNIAANESQTYIDAPSDLYALKWPYESRCEDSIYGNIVVQETNGKRKVLISPYLGNMYLELDEETGRMSPWKLPIEMQTRSSNGYMFCVGMGGFVYTYQHYNLDKYYIWYFPERKLFEADLIHNAISEVDIVFDRDEVLSHESGFALQSEWIQYCCCENAFNTLNHLLDDKIIGNSFDRNIQIEKYQKINSDSNGRCGDRVWDYILRTRLN